jgi:hypothetical protein
MISQKTHRAGEAIGYEREPRRTVEAGVVYGHLKTVERVKRGGQALWKCVCINERDGQECGRERIMRGFQLLKSNFRACRECADEHTKDARRRFTQGF